LTQGKPLFAISMQMAAPRSCKSNPSAINQTALRLRAIRYPAGKNICLTPKAFLIKWLIILFIMRKHALLQLFRLGGLFCLRDFMGFGFFIACIMVRELMNPLLIK